MKKILHLNNFISQTSGVTRYIYNIVKNTSSHFEHEIVCLGGDAIESFNDLNVKVTVMKGKSKLIIPYTYLSLIKYFKNNRCEIIHNHHRLFDTLTSIIPNRKYKTLTTVHSKVYGHTQLSYRAAKLISVSDSITKHLIEHHNVNHEKILRIKNFVDLSNYNIQVDANELRKRLNLNDRKIILFIGRFSKEKGVDILIKAFKKFSELNNKISLMMIGEGEDENFLRKFSLENNLQLKILKPLVNIYDYYNIADVIVLPSRVDPFPFVMLEAGLMNKPFIGSYVDGIPELIKHRKNGLLFDSENVGDLVSSLKMILEDKTFAQQIANNLHYEVIENYTAVKVIPEYIKLYHSLVD